MELNLGSVKHDLFKGKGPFWPEKPFRASGLDESDGRVYSLEVWWEAPRFIMVSLPSERLSEVLKAVKIVLKPQSKLPSKLDEATKLLSGQDPYWRMYAVDFEDKKTIRCHFVHFEAGRVAMNRLDELCLKTEQADELVLLFKELDSDMKTSPKRSLVYKRTQGEDESSQRVTLGVWSEPVGHEIVQAYADGGEKTAVFPAYMDLEIEHL